MKGGGGGAAPPLPPRTIQSPPSGHQSSHQPTGDYIVHSAADKGHGVYQDYDRVGDKTAPPMPTLPPALPPKKSQSAEQTQYVFNLSFPFFRSVVLPEKAVNKQTNEHDEMFSCC